MPSQKARWLIILTSGLFLLADRLLKWQAIHNWTTSNLFSPYLGWQIYLNKGVAFSLPLTKIPAIMLSMPIIVLVSYLLIKEMIKKDGFSVTRFFAWSLLLSGSISNFFDRIVYNYVIDYLLVGTAIINLGDMLIVAGLVLYLIGIKKDKKV